MGNTKNRKFSTKINEIVENFLPVEFLTYFHHKLLLNNKIHNRILMNKNIKISRAALRKLQTLSLECLAEDTPSGEARRVNLTYYLTMERIKSVRFENFMKNHLINRNL